MESNLSIIENCIENINSMSPLQIRDSIQEVEDRMARHPSAKFGDSCPLVHNFAKGIYIREMCTPPNYVITTKIHKNSHATFILSGEVLVIEENGVKTINHPCYFITKPNTKRLIICKTAVSWVTVHHTHLTNIKDIEEEIISKTFTDKEATPCHSH